MRQVAGGERSQSLQLDPFDILCLPSCQLTGGRTDGRADGSAIFVHLLLASCLRRSFGAKTRSELPLNSRPMTL